MSSEAERHTIPYDGRTAEKHYKIPFITDDERRKKQDASRMSTAIHRHLRSLEISTNIATAKCAKLPSALIRLKSSWAARTTPRLQSLVFPSSLVDEFIASSAPQGPRDEPSASISSNIRHKCRPERDHFGGADEEAAAQQDDCGASETTVALIGVCGG